MVVESSPDQRGNQQTLEIGCKRKLSPEQKASRRRILHVSHEHKLSHLGSCLSVVDIISAVYKVKTPDEKFVLSSGHAGVALYVILEREGLLENTTDIGKLNIHPDRNPEIGIDVSTGSLGQGLPIAVGMSLANRCRNVYCVISDGECTEGSIWEALRIASELKLYNLRVILNANGYSAYNEIDVGPLRKRFEAFGWRAIEVDGHSEDGITDALLSNEDPAYPRDLILPTIIIAHTTVEQLPFLKGQDAHYKVMTDQEYTLAMAILQ